MLTVLHTAGSAKISLEIRKSQGTGTEQPDVTDRKTGMAARCPTPWWPGSCQLQVVPSKNLNQPMNKEMDPSLCLSACRLHHVEAKSFKKT